MDPLFERGQILENALSDASTMEQWMAANEEIISLEVDITRLQIETGEAHIAWRRMEMNLNMATEELSIQDL